MNHPLPFDLIFRPASSVRRVGLGDVAPSTFPQGSCPIPATLPGGAAGACQPNPGLASVAAPAVPTGDQSTWWLNAATTLYGAGGAMPVGGTLPANYTAAQFYAAAANLAAHAWLVDHPADATLTGATPFAGGAAPANTISNGYLYTAAQWVRMYATSAANAALINWNGVPWSTIPQAFWTWLGTLPATFNWPMVTSALTTQVPLPSGGGIVNWGTQDFTNTGAMMQTAQNQAAVAGGAVSGATQLLSGIAWANPFWNSVPFQSIPFASLASSSFAGITTPQQFLALVQAAQTPATGGGSGGSPLVNPGLINKGSTPGATTPGATACTNAGGTYDATALACTYPAMTQASCTSMGGTYNGTTQGCTVADAAGLCLGAGNNWNASTSTCTPAASLAASCAAGGGTWNSVTASCTPASGMSTTKEVVIGAGVLAVIGAAAAWWYETKMKHPRSPR